MNQFKEVIIFLSNEIISILNAICDKVGIAIDWSSQVALPELIDMLNRYGLYLLFDGIHTLIWGILLVLIGIVLIRQTYKSFESSTWAADIVEQTNWNGNEELHKSCSGLGIAAYIISIVAILIGIGDISIGIDGILKAATVPDVYAAQKIIDMLQNNS